MTPVLYAPKWYWELPEAERKKGRCGAGSGFGEWIVPETIWFINITDACRIHDQMYAKGNTMEDKQEADRVFLNNMLRIVDIKGKSRIHRWLASRRAYKYYEAVRDLGGTAYWNKKNNPEEWGIQEES